MSSINRRELVGAGLSMGAAATLSGRSLFAVNANEEINLGAVHSTNLEGQGVEEDYSGIILQVDGEEKALFLGQGGSRCMDEGARRERSIGVLLYLADTGIVGGNKGGDGRIEGEDGVSRRPEGGRGKRRREGEEVVG